MLFFCTYCLSGEDAGQPGLFEGLNGLHVAEKFPPAQEV